MPPITLKGARVESFSVERNSDGEMKITCRYALLSSEGRVLAKQSVGGYNDMTIEPSVVTTQALQAFLKAYNDDIGRSIGLDVE